MLERLPKQTTKEDITVDEIRSETKRTLESFEHWSRRLIDDEMSRAYGENYFELKFDDGNRLIKKEILQNVEGRMHDDPGRFPRKIDAILLDDIGYFFCKDDFYDNCFKNVFEKDFSGVNEIRNRIEKMTKIRNKLYHGNTISEREAEQAICYSHDFIDCYNDYYKKIGKSKVYNVPQFIKVEDSYGRCKYRQGDKIEDLSVGNGCLELRPGDIYKIWVEVDSVFPEQFYDITWFMDNREVGHGKYFEYSPKVKDVSAYRLIRLYCSLTTKREWHKSGNSDDWYDTTIGQILPPIEDSY